MEPSLILDAIDYLNTKKLLSLSKYVMQGGRALVEFVDYNRTAARTAGVETIAVELSGIIDSGHIQSVYDSLHEAAFSGRESKLSREGLTYLRRSERLLAEATSNLVRFSGAAPGGLGRGSYSLSGQEPSVFPTGLIIIGTIIAVIILLAVLLRK
jgi:hypothetical protein